MKSDKGFSSFFESFKKGGAVKIGIIFALGIMLIVFSSLDVKGKEENKTDEQERIALVCSEIEGIGRCEVMLNYSTLGRVESAVIVCDGADNVKVKERIVDLFTSLYGIGANRISIQRMKKE